MPIRRAISFLAAAILVAGCAHASNEGGSSDEKPGGGDAAGDQMKTIDDALEVELEDVRPPRSVSRRQSDLDTQFWEQDDGIAEGTVFGEPQPGEATTDSDAVATARNRVVHAHRRGRHGMLVAAISAASDGQVEQILAWREELRRISPRATTASVVADMKTIRAGFERASAADDWQRVLELDRLLADYRGELDARSIATARMAVRRAVDALMRWKHPVVAAAHFHAGDRAVANRMAAQWVAGAGGDPFAISVELAGRLADLGASEMSRELLGRDVLETAIAAQQYRGRAMSTSVLADGVRLLGELGEADELASLWARRYLQASAGSSEAGFRAALNTCTQSLDDRHCWVETPRMTNTVDAAAEVMLACRYYQYRREWRSTDEARDGFRRFVEACDANCRQKTEAVRFGDAMCGPAVLNAADSPEMNEALVAVPLQFGDFELAVEVMDAQSVHPASRARLVLSVVPRHYFLRSPADKRDAVERVVAWLEEAERLAESDPGGLRDGGPPDVSVASLRLSAAEFAREVGYDERAIEVLADMSLAGADAPRLVARTASLLVDLGRSDRAADLIVSTLDADRRRQIEPWVAPLTRKLTPRHALRVYRVAASRGYARMAMEGLALAVEENDIQSARVIDEAADATTWTSGASANMAEARLQKAAETNPEWAAFYLRLLERKPPDKRTRLERIRVARVVGDTGEADKALARWVSVFVDDPLPCASLSIALRDGPDADMLEALIRRDDPGDDARPRRLMLSMMLRMRMRRAQGDPLRLDSRFRERITALAERIVARSPMVCASPIGFADIVAGHGFPEAALAILDATREQGRTRNRHGIPLGTVQQRYLEMRVALDIADIRRAREAIARVESSRGKLRRALQRELGWYLVERGEVSAAADLLDKSLVSLERMYVEEARAPTDYEPLRRWRAERTSIERVDDTLVALARLRVQQGRGEAFAKKLEALLARSSLDSVRRRRLALRLVSVFDEPAERGALLQAMATFGTDDRLWILGARAEFIDGEVDRGFAKFDMRASQLASPYSFWLEQAYWFVGRGEFGVARRAMERARRLGGDGPGLAVARGRIALMSGDDATALREFRAALQQLHLRTTVEQRVVEALEDTMREDLLGELESEGLIQRTARSGGLDTTLRFKKLQAALRDKKPGAAIAEFLALEDVLHQRGQLDTQARAVARLVVAGGHPGAHELSQVLIRHELSEAALILVDAEDGPNLEDSFRLWVYLRERVGRKAVSLALDMLDPASDAYNPDDALRLVGAFDYHRQLLLGGRQRVERLGVLSASAPFVIDALVVRGELDRALSRVQATATFVESHRDVLTSAQLERWGAIQGILVQRGLASEAQSILGYAPFAGPLGWIERPDPREEQSQRSLWRQMSPLSRAGAVPERAASEPWLPGPAELGNEELGGLAPALLRASAPFAAKLLNDELLSARVEAAPGHAPARVAWIVTVFEAGEMERARGLMRAYLERRVADEAAVEKLVVELGRRGFWSELAVVAAPVIVRKTPRTEHWLERARAEIDGDDALRGAEPAAAIRAALSRPFPLAPHEDRVIASALAAEADAGVSGAARMRAVRELGPLEQWCRAPESLETVLALARVRVAPEVEQLEACERARLSGGEGRAAPQRGHEARLDAYRQGVRRGLLSPSDYHAYRVLRWTME